MQLREICRSESFECKTFFGMECLGVELMEWKDRFGSNLDGRKEGRGGDAQKLGRVASRCKGRCRGPGKECVQYIQSSVLRSARSIRTTGRGF